MGIGKKQSSKTNDNSVSFKDYQSDMIKSSEFYQTHFPINSDETTSKPSIMTFSAEDNLVNKVTSFCKAMGIMNTEDYMRIIKNLKTKSIDVEHACTCIYFFTIVQSRWPTETISFEKFSKDRRQLEKIVSTKVQLIKECISQNPQMLKPKSESKQKVDKSQEISSILTYMDKIYWESNQNVSR